MNWGDSKIQYVESGIALMLAAGLLALSGARPASAEESPDYRVEQFRWQEPIGRPLMVIVENPHGNVRSRSWDKDNLSVTGQLQRDLADPPLEVHVEVQRQTVRITVSDPVQGKGVNSEIRRADLVILAPTGLNMSVQTQNGEIHFKKYVGDVTAHSVEGNISLRTNGSVDAITEAGSITTKLDGKWDGMVSLQTDTGAIQVFVPEDTNTHIEAKSTTGKVESELSSKLLSDVNSQDHLFFATLGSGVQKLQAKSDSGDIHIRKRPR